MFLNYFYCKIFMEMHMARNIPGNLDKESQRI